MEDKEQQRAAEMDGYADGRENVVWRAQRHDVTCRRSYEIGFQRGQRERLARLGLVRRPDADPSDHPESAATREPWKEA
jgi:hypothetical protein